MTSSNIYARILDMEWQYSSNEKHETEQALARAELQLGRGNHILNRNTGSSHSTTPQQKTQCAKKVSSAKELNTHFKENVDNKGPIIYKRSFGYHPDEDEPLSPDFLFQQKTPIVNPARSRSPRRSIAGKKRQDTPAPTQTSKRRRLHILDRAVERKLLRRARQSVKELEWKVLQPSITRPMLRVVSIKTVKIPKFIFLVQKIFKFY